jgi:multiple sugar transport system permease protein
MVRRHNPGYYVQQVVLHVVLLALAFVFLFPIFWLVTGAFKPSDDIIANPPLLWPQRWTLDNFSQVFTTAPFARWIFNTTLVATVVTAFGLLFHSMAAYSLARLKYPGRGILFVGIVSTLMITFPVILVPLFILVKDLGWINTYWALIIPNIFNAYGIFLLRQFYLGIPRELEEAAIIDGTSLVGVYYRIILPLSRPILSALGVFFFLANWNFFLWPLVVTTDPNLQVLQVGIATFSTQFGSAWNLILAASLVATLPIVVLFAFFQKYIVESVKMQGLKL